MSIKVIDPSSIHRITSGQVVVDLQTAVKELIENSLDAGATSIEVRFKDYGLKSIDVIDDGHGIPKEDYECIALKHHTSKLLTYEDLAIVQTFGFRGEALSSLCALSASVTVTTATAAEAPMGAIIEFYPSGKLKSHSGKIARKRGTTVTISGLFTPLPVRRKEFERNAKREFSKALSLLHAYALVPCTRENKGVRLTVSNQPDRGSKSVQIQTDATTVRNSVLALWGPKALDNTVPLNLRFEVESERPSALKRYGIQQQAAITVHVQGLISKFEVGCGRTSTDRQFFFVNGRPCNSSKIQKAFNEVYRSFNTNQAPFIIADLQLPTNRCDINVSPDKRTIFIHNENNLLRSLKIALENAFSASRSTFTVNEVGFTHNPRQGSTAEETIMPPADDHTLVTEEERADNAIHIGPSSASLTNSKTNYGEVANDSRHQNETHEDVCKTAEHAPGRSRTLSRSSRGDNSEKEVESGIEPDVDMASEHEVSSANGVSTTLKGDTSLPIDVDYDPSNCKLSERISTRRPLFISPSPSPSTRTGEDSSSPVSRRRLNDTESSAASSLEEVVEPLPKRRRTGSPVSTRTPSVQLVLATKNAAWNLQVKHKDDKLSNDMKSRRVKDVKARLNGFAMPGTQIKPIQVEEDEEEDLGALADSTLPEEDQLIDDDDIESPQVKDVNNELNALVTRPKVTEDFLETPDHSLALTADIDFSTSDVHEPSVLTSSVDQTTVNEITQTPVSTSILRIDLSRLSSIWARIHSSSSSPVLQEPLSTPALHATANVAKEEAEKELSRVIHKEDFASMQVIGQFNFGFIVARRLVLQDQGTDSADDLFIVDQHASDEKYNFETLQHTTKIESQKLFKPRSLELTAADEMVAMENIEVLRYNGFEFSIDENAAAGNRERIKLVAQPVSKGTTFDIHDLAELLHLMQDQPRGQMVRSSKARAMFAMRACRKSVMVGMPLTVGQMTAIVRHMGTMEQPWNCPHGRPTMRHLVSLTQLKNGRSVGKEVNWSEFLR